MAKSEFFYLNQNVNLKENKDENFKEGESSGTQGEKTESRSGGRRGRKPAKLDMKMKLERSQQSARECRARKKLRYQYLEELVSSREKAIQVLKKELETYKVYCKSIDEGHTPKEVLEMSKDKMAE